MSLAADPSSAQSQQIKVRVLSRKIAESASVNGLVFVLEPDGDSVQKATRPTVTVDYSGFGDMAGGAYGPRLRLFELPACAVTTPSRTECRTMKPLITRNDGEKQLLTTSGATLSSGTATVLAATTGAASDAGDYQATSLSQSATWGTDLNTGNFGWSYPIPTPEVPGGLGPGVGLSYSSGAIDGRSGGTNNQSSWVGDGFDLWPGYIERRYKPCADDGVKNADGSKPGDLCWGYDNAVISFNGRAGELVPVSENEWRLKDDDGTKITRAKDANRGNGDADNEYWKVVTPDGTQYFFGYHKLNGWAEGKPTTGSTWITPVFGDDAGEPCHAETFAESWCQQAWRWNLDYVADSHGNAVAYYYNRETNSYGRNLKATDDTRYGRGGYLDRIEYGLSNTDLYATPALAKVDFTSAERCLPQTGVTCEPDTIDAQSQYWYDTPWDLNCNSGTDCDQGRLSPTFWTRKRLTQIDTQILKSDGTYATLDTWKLGHRWGTADVDYQLLLDSVQHVGQSTTPAITLPKTTFKYTQRPNRLDKLGDGKAPFIKERLSSIVDESGGQVEIAYSEPVCDWATLPTPQSNTSRCFPQFIEGSTTDDPTQQWFNKYVVESVTETDRTGGALDSVTRYTYLGGAAWHYDDDDGLTKEKFKTWSTWRGYGHVRELTGGQTGMKSQVDTYFLRGMDGDRSDTSDGTRSVVIPLNEGEGEPITDHPSAAGFAYRTETYSGPNGKVLEKTVSRPWHHETARRVRSWGTVTANFTGRAESRTFTSLDDGAGAQWRTAASTTAFDTVAGRPVRVDDQGDIAVGTDNQCTRTTYVDNPARNLLSAASRVETVAAACSATDVDRSKDVISDIRTAYDGGGYGDAPTKGDATSVATLKTHSGTQATYLESGATVDAYGREVAVTDLTGTVVFDTADNLVSRTPRSDGRTTTTAYTPATGIPTQVRVTTPPAKAGDAATAQTTTTTLDPLRSLPTAEVDANNRKTEYVYDALGRTTKIWLANRSKANEQTPNYEYRYLIAENAPVAVATTTLALNNARLTSYTIYDGFLRPRQIQTPGPDGGRLISDTFYDDRGLATKSFDPYYALGAPSATLQTVDNALSVESQTWNSHDGLGRQTESKHVLGNGSDSVVLSTSRSIYGGDRTTVIPPKGATATTTLTNARGQVTELRQHHSPSATAPYDATHYRYTPAGQLAELTDPAGNSWTWSYDQLGRATTTTDPDQGTTHSEYDDRSQLVSTTDSQDQTLFRTYDNLGRQIALRSGSATGNLLAEWTYDTVSKGVGELATSTRYDNGHPYTTTVVEYDALYRAVHTNITIPENEGALAGTYPLLTGYNADGTLNGYNFPPAGSLPGGGITYGYDTIQRPVEITDAGGMKATTTYSATGKPLQSILTNSTTDKRAQITNTYERGTERLATTRVDREGVTGVDKDAAYTYDEAGNVLSVSDTSRSGTDTQCFLYDYLGRTTNEWTQSTPCAAAPTTSAVGGPAPYWNTYTYDVLGNRLTEVRHDLTGDTTKNVERTYTYPEAVNAHPHALTSVSTKSPTGNAVDNYTYYPSGATKTRTIDGTTQSLAWNPEGLLTSVTEPVEGGDPKTTSYVYDAEGNRLIRRTPTESTLYLGATEITVTNGSSPKATRYMDLGNGAQAVQTDDGAISFVVGDHHGTGQLAIATDATLTLQQRRTEPFGAPRGPAPPAWPGTKGFVGGTDDPSTGLTHLGAREYDPLTGRFISVDPVMDLADPQQLQGYVYANHNPATYSDPSGLFSFGDIGSAIGKGIGNAWGGIKGGGKKAGGWVEHQWNGLMNSADSFMLGVAHQVLDSAYDFAEGFYRIIGQDDMANDIKADREGRNTAYDITQNSIGEPRDNTAYRIGRWVGEFFFPYIPGPAGGSALAKGATRAPKLSRFILKALSKNLDDTPGKIVAKGPENIPAHIQPIECNQNCGRSELAIVERRSPEAVGARSAANKAYDETPQNIVGPGEVRTGDVHGDVVVRGGTVHGDVHGTVVIEEGGTVIGNVQNVIQIGTHNIIGELGPPGANSLVGNVHGVAVQAGRVSGEIIVNGRRLWPPQ